MPRLECRWTELFVLTTVITSGHLSPVSLNWCPVILLQNEPLSRRYLGDGPFLSAAVNGWCAACAVLG